MERDRTRRSSRARLGAPLGLAAACGLATPAAAQLTEPFPAVFELEHLLPAHGGDGSLGIVLDTTSIGSLPADVAPAGDVNDDGVTDVIIGVPVAGGFEGAGSAFVVFSGAGGALPVVLDVAQLDGDNGFRLEGGESRARAGRSVAAAGDVNGDGVDDVIVGASGSVGSSVGRSFVVFGRAGGGFPASIDLMKLDGSDGFRLEGDGLDGTGRSVASAGDMNGDGAPDLIIAADGGYVVFGRAGGGFPAVVDLPSLNGDDGFRLTALGAGESGGGAVAMAGDINGDGVDDLLVGAPGRYDLHSYRYDSGKCYVVFGRDGGGFPASLPVSVDTTVYGYRDLALGTSVAPAGDFNGDGRADVIIGGPASWDLSTPPDGFGTAFVVFGGDGFPDLHLEGLAPHQGVRLVGHFGERCGESVASTGDVNSDGFDDVAISAPYGSASPFRGEIYVLFGSDDLAPSVSPENLDGTIGFRILSGPHSGAIVGGGGDFNDDGTSDLLVASQERVYIIYGRHPDAPCYADCDGSGELDFFDFLCFQNLFAAGDPKADCDESGELEFFDFLCFQNAFAEGCP